MIDFKVPLENDSVSLVQAEQKHFDEMYEVAKDPKLWDQHNAKDRCKKEVFSKFFNKGLENENGLLAIIDKKNNKIIGSTRYYPHKEKLSIGYTFISRKYWGTSTNFQVKKLMLDFAFQVTDEIFFHVWEDNFRSQKAVQKLGAEFFGNWDEEENHLTFILKKNKWNNLNADKKRLRQAG